MAAKLKIQDDDQREKIFMEILSLLWSEEKDFKTLSQKAGVSISTLYNWAELKVFAPRIDTLSKVARALGYEIVLRLNKPKLTIVK